jgi:hypothetical protein
MLVGRDSEQATIDALLGHARSGISGTLVVRGEPGIGKSALLRYAASRAEGMTVLSATGIESESELPFSGLAELLQPIVTLIGDIPEPQAAALAGALALAPPTAPEPFVVSAAILSLLALAAERRPLLVVVDDAHWLDASSRDALMFATRRLHADAAAVLFAVRDDDGAATITGPPELVLHGLDAGTSQALLARAMGSKLPAVVAERIQAATGGNPLAILELPRVLSPAQLSGSEPLPDPLPAGPSVQRSFEWRVAALPQPTQQALLLVAASQSGSIAEIRRAASSLDITLDTLNVAESAGLITNDGLRIDFRHPLMRAAVYHGATPVDRRGAHRALASAMPPGGPPMEKAWHFAAAAQGEDEVVAAHLEEAALDARRRSGHASAARAFERAARLSPEPEQRARRLHEAGSDAYVAGDSAHARALLDEALSLAGDPALRAKIEHSRGRVEMWTRSPAAARQILVEAADRIAAEDPESATLMLVDAVTTSMQEGDPGEGVDRMVQMTLRLSEQAYALGSRAGGTARAVAGGAYGKALVGFGRPQQAHPLLVGSLAAIDAKASLWLAVQLIQYAAMFLYFEEFDRMRVPLEGLIAAAVPPAPRARSLTPSATSLSWISGLAGGRRPTARLPRRSN